MSAQAIRVLLVDDHPVVRDGINAMLSAVSHIDVCGYAAGGLEAVAMARELVPDVIVMDIGLPDLNGLEATQQITANRPEARVGARGYLIKNSPSADLLQAIEAVHEGQLRFPAQWSDLVLEEVAEHGAEIESGAVPTLSTRERQVLALIAGGLSNRDIAERLSLSVRTVETHRQHVMDKLDIHSVAGLTKYAITEGLTHVG